MKLTKSEQKNLEYWRGRSESRLVSSEQLAEFAVVDVSRIYSTAQKNIEAQIKSVYANYARNGILSKSELQKAIGVSGKNEFLRKIARQARILKLDPNQIYDERYLARLTRLEALLEQVKLEMMAVAEQEERTTGNTYREIIKKGYQSTQNDLSSIGVPTPFSTIDNLAVDTIMRAKWYGGNYSSRIWNNTGKLAETLPTILGGGLLSGESYAKTSRKLAEKMDVGLYEATRLVRTETNFFNGQTELQAFIDDGILMYELHATLDDRTSKICRRMNRRVFFVADAVVGVNYNPFHGHCRTIAVAYFGDKIPEGGISQRQRAKYIGNQQATTKRFERFADYDNDEIKKRWKEAMQKQMNPEKTGQTHDYNADMNLLTQAKRAGKLTPEQYQKGLNDLMASIPEDYPLKDALQNVAKLEGWEKPVVSEYKQAVNKLFEDAGIDVNDIKTNDIQDRFITKSKLKLQQYRSGTDDINGAYNPQTNTMELEVANIKKFAQDTKNPDFVNRVFQHELGHAVDAFAPQFRADIAKFSDSPEFMDIMFKGNRPTNEANRIAQYREASTIANENLAKSIKNMTPEVFNQMAITREGITVDGIEYKVMPAQYFYYTEIDELFAESYALFHIDSKWLEKNAPATYKYISDIATKKL